MIALADCTFLADPNDAGLFVGRCREFPDVRTRPMRSRLDAIDAIIASVREKIRHRDAAIDIVRRWQ